MARIRMGCGRTTRRAVSVVAGRVRVYRGTRFSPIGIIGPKPHPAGPDRLNKATVSQARHGPNGRPPGGEKQPGPGPMPATGTPGP